MTRLSTSIAASAWLALTACPGGGSDDSGTGTGTDPGTSNGPTSPATSDDPTVTEPTTAGPTSSPTGETFPDTTEGPTASPTSDATSGPTTDPSTGTESTGDATTMGDDTSTGDTGTETTGGDDSTLCASQAEGLYFPADAWFYEDVSDAPVTADSQAITQWMVQNAGPNGWGTGTMRIDFSIVAMDAAEGTPKRDFMLDEDYYYVPDCDDAPIPLPPGGYVEDYPQDPPDPNDPWANYDCSGFADGADCHILVVARAEQRLYEVYHGTADANSFTVGCEAIWDLSQAPGADGRGQQCTSADAAGFPIAPLLFTAEEVKAGEIKHAIRFILPNSMIRAKKYVYPATHGTNTTGPMTSIPYGGHMRLRADYPLQNLKPAAQVVAKAMQKYGMYMADGGNIALTAQGDALGCATWEEVDLGPNDLAMLKATDFEVIDRGPTMDVTFDCTRQQIIE
jgi:serine/threonine-protein kinase